MSNPAAPCSPGTYLVTQAFLQAVAANYFNTVEGQPGYCPLYDLNGDGVIDISDMVIFASLAGQTITLPYAPPPTPPEVTASAAALAAVDVGLMAWAAAVSAGLV